MSLLAGRRILIVDDEEDLREILVDEFAFNGANVIAVGSGNAAFGLLERESFDAVITDLMMSDGDGPTLARRINERLNPRPKLFLCTGFSALTTAQLSELNVTAVFEKPFARDQLIGTVARALADERA